MRILIIDNNIDPSYWGSPELRRFGRLAAGSTVYVRRAPHDDLPANPGYYDRVIVSGSRTSALDDAPWISRLHDFIRKTIDRNIPYLGVCYGHQSLARALGAPATGGKETVRVSAEPEFGWTEINVLEPSALLKGLPNTFYTFSSHFEEVAALPPRMKCLASSNACSIQACQLEGRPIFGIQFHPEKNAAEAELTFKERKKKGSPKKLLHPNKTDELYDPKIGETIFSNFLSEKV